jgi:hypothetical protein
VVVLYHLPGSVNRPVSAWVGVGRQSSAQLEGEYKLSAHIGHTVHIGLAVKASILGPVLQEYKKLSVVYRA